MGERDMQAYVEQEIAKIKEQIGGKKAICGLSGGVDSTVSAVMAHRAVGRQLTCVFVDHGLMRKNEPDEVEQVCREKFDMNFVRVDARDEFLGKLAGVVDPEEKRRIIGETFIRVFERESRKIGNVSFLVQGTIYPDILESGIEGSAKVKSHHNVGGLPDLIDFEGIIEPVKMLYKEEVRRAGLVLGIPEELVRRQPFPGPGLGVRILGAITPQRANTLREADAIFREEIIAAGLHTATGLQPQLAQYFAVLTDLRSVGVTRGERTYESAIALRAVSTTDFMTARFVPLPWELLAKVSARIVSEVPGVNRVVYDITDKPPGTVEWE